MCSIHKGINIEMRYFDIEKFPRYDILSNEISRYFQNIEILPSTTARIQICESQSLIEGYFQGENFHNFQESSSILDDFSLVLLTIHDDS